MRSMKLGIAIALLCVGAIVFDATRGKPVKPSAQIAPMLSPPAAADQSPAAPAPEQPRELTFAEQAQLVLKATEQQKLYDELHREERIKREYIYKIEANLPSMYEFELEQGRLGRIADAQREKEMREEGQRQLAERARIRKEMAAEGEARAKANLERKKINDEIWQKTLEDERKKKVEQQARENAEAALEAQRQQMQEPPLDPRSERLTRTRERSLRSR